MDFHSFRRLEDGHASHRRVFARFVLKTGNRESATPFFVRQRRVDSEMNNPQTVTEDASGGMTRPR